MGHEGEVKVGYLGDPAKLFPLALGTGVLGLLTLGVYRFWGKARIRRHVWSKVRLDGDGFEFTGTGLEMFLGFLLSVVVLAIYLAVVQLVLFAVGIRFVLDPQNRLEEFAQGISILLSFVAVLPLMIFAVYRSRRYKLARTRFRGIRLAMENAAGAYTLRAMGYLLLVVLSLGLLWPLMTFRLEAFMTERTWYGTSRFRQGGSWRGLYPAYGHVVAGIVLCLAGTALGIAGGGGFPVFLVIAGLVWAAIGFVVYRVRAFAYLMSHKMLDGGVGFRAMPATGTVIWLYIKGAFIAGLLGGLASAMIFAPLGTMLAGIESASQLVQVEIAVLGAASYLLLLTVFGALGLVFISQPILGHFIGSVTVTGAGALEAVRQRGADGGADAEGFADALDIGGAF